ncbi:MAG: glycyl-radical enzyme activating protein [Aigarchaeota archaeon]|nr:glycyl-radical enzyme activating protein [Aigarchaeota archaeon]
MLNSKKQTKAPNQSIKGRIFDIESYAIHDGPGIRTTVFMKGCPLRCWWCHNPEGIDFSKNLMYFDYKCIRCKTCMKACPTNAISFNGEEHIINRTYCSRCGICAERCPTGALRLVGYDITVYELVREIEKDVLLYDRSGGGVTFSGGEPLFQPLFLKEVLKECKNRGIHVALDTTGYAPPEIFRSFIDIVDLFLYDIKLLDDKEHIKYTGVSNEPIKKNLMTIVERGKGNAVILRFPVIPGITDTEKNLNELLVFLSELKGIDEIDILPFHDVNEKYERLGIEYKMKGFRAPSKEKLIYIKEKLEGAGFFVKIWG